MQKLTVCSLAALGTVLALGACHNRPGARHDPDMGAGASTKHAVHAIAKARCEREKRCEHVGHDKEYSSLDACKDTIEHAWASDLNKYECPHGIVTAELEQCLTDVRDEECGNPLDTLSRIAQCDADDICDGD